MARLGVEAGLARRWTRHSGSASTVRAAASAQPAVAVAVVIEDAEALRTDNSEGWSAAPIARAVMEEGLRLEAAARGQH